MKKRPTVLIFAAVLAFSAAACSNGSNSDVSSEASENSLVSHSSPTVSENSSSEKSADESKKASGGNESAESPESSAISEADAKKIAEKKFFNVVKNGTYYLKMTMDKSTLGINFTYTDNIVEDIPESITVTFAADAKNKRIYIDFGYPTISFSKIIVAGGKQWIVCDEQKTAYYMTASADTESLPENITGSSLKIDGLKYKSADEEKFNGKSAIAVVYTVPVNINDASDVSADAGGFYPEHTYYFDKKTEALVGIKAEADSICQTCVVDDFKTSVPDSLFDIPSDYKKLSLEDAVNSN